MRKTELITISIILTSFAISLWFYGIMPEKMVFHWNAEGKPDGYSSKEIALFLMPVISIILFAFFLAIPKIDPLKKNLMKFRKQYERFMLITILFLVYLQIISIAWNLGNKFNFIQVLAPAFAIMFYYCGVLMQKAKRNWFIGIRNPWTISSERVWNKTHEIGAKLFKIAGVIALLAIPLQEYAIILIIAPVLSITAYLFIFSYIEYNNKEKNNSINFRHVKKKVNK